MVELRIVVDDAGHMNVTGPLHNIITCYGMLEMARDVIQAHAAAQAKRTIAPASGADIVAISGHRS